MMSGDGITVKKDGLPSSDYVTSSQQSVSAVSNRPTEVHGRSV